MKTVALLATLSLSCLHSSSWDTIASPAPPVWDADCDPGVEWVSELAITEDYSLGDTPSDPAEARDACFGELSRRGFLVMYRPQKDRAASTRPYLVFLGEDWDSLPVETQASVVCHELVHAKWEQDVGLHALKIYATSSGRLAAEANAYRESYRVQLAIGVSPKLVERRQRARAKDLGKIYRLRGDAARCQEVFMLKVFGLDLL